MRAKHGHCLGIRARQRLSRRGLPSVAVLAAYETRTGASSYAANPAVRPEPAVAAGRVGSSARRAEYLCAELSSRGRCSAYAGRLYTSYVRIR